MWLIARKDTHEVVRCSGVVENSRQPGVAFSPPLDRIMAKTATDKALPVDSLIGFEITDLIQAGEASGLFAEGALEAVFINEEFTGYNKAAPDYIVGLKASSDGSNWDSDAVVDLGKPIHFRLQVQAGAKPVSILNGKTKLIPIFLAGATSVIYKKATFSVAGDAAEAVVSWTPDKNTDYLIRPVDILRSYPNVTAHFITGDARCEVAD